MSGDQKNIFSDLIVVELASVLAGPAVGLFFAELGAKVIKVENTSTKGDITRHWKTKGDDPDNKLSAYYYSVNWNKEAHLIDLENKEERNLVLKWIESADIVISNFKHGSDIKLGMDYHSLRAINTSLIYANISAYGNENPTPGFDVSMQAETGWVYMNGDSEGPPVKMPVALIDILAAHQLKEGILIALLQRMKTGDGSQVSVSLYDTSIASLANQASNWLNLQQLPERMGSSHPNISPYGDIVSTKDGLQIMITAGTQKQFLELCDFLEMQELKDDSDFRSNLDRVENRKNLIKLLQLKIARYTISDLRAKDQDLKSVLVPIQNLQQVFENQSAKELVLTQQENDGRESKRVKTAIFKISN